MNIAEKPDEAVIRAEVSDYQTFLKENQRKTNLLLNKFLRFSILIGPLLMLAIRLGIFHSVTYTSCLIVSALVLLLSCIHYALIKREGNTLRAAFIAFQAIDLVLILMNSAHIGIYLTWFVVPLISLLFCDFKIYGVAVALNYVMMTLSVWLVSPYYANLRVDFESAFQYFMGRMGGFTIEMVIMVVAGYGLCKVSTDHYQELIYTIQNIARQKKKEEQLIRISMTDELTGLNNRRSYDTDIELYKEKELEEDLVVFSIDVNGLKEANDTRGHVAGDELLTATAECLTAVFGSRGKVYRTGGDEFIAIAVTDDPGSFLEQIKRFSASGNGAYGDHLSVSVGFASHRDHPEADIHGLEVFADQMMYQEKERYYSSPGIDRRRHLPE
ncbi:MAG: GGDEF domain-containing protein [Clostridia bacterium]|nr:GGDEF domain-containing protein [Clostridia bacterium]